jgi:acetolactate synthase-1/2/3 large subunit
MTKIKLSDFISLFLEKNGIDSIFSITGGYSMMLTDSFGNNKNLNNYFMHHEQSCGYAAVGYAKTNAKPVVVCTTAGCAATNAITPCLVAHQDSLPIFFISGQVKSKDTICNINKNTSLKVRHYSGADSDIISMVTPITKYAYQLDNANIINSVLNKMFTEMMKGRPGPVWLSIPLDLQGTYIHYQENLNLKINLSLSNDIIHIFNYTQLNEKLKNAKRPVILAGNGIKLADCQNKFQKFIKRCNIPVVVSIHGTDILESDDPLFCGKVGIIGDRLGNFTIQNCDLLISMGCRMAQCIVGYREDWFAREASIIYIDNDYTELEKKKMNYDLNYDLKIQMDLKTFFKYAKIELTELPDYTEWVNTCSRWKRKWMYEMPEQSNDIINPYHALKIFFDIAPPNKNIIVSSGSIVTNVWHMVNIKKGDKYIVSSQGDMGFELPASIGSALVDKTKMIIPIMGEGSLQLNIQELQTIVHLNIPIKIMIFNNNTHGATKLTQSIYFNNFYGVDKDSGISFPDTEKICYAYGIKYIAIKKIEEIEEKMREFLNTESYVLCEIFCCIQSRYPRLNAVKNEDGTFSNRPFEDMEPFISREEFEKEMIVKIV